MASILETAKLLNQAALSGKPIPRFTATNPKFALQDGYQVQRELLEIHRARGEKLVGYKMGMTSQAKMQQMNLKAPIHGFLTDAMQVVDGGAISLEKRIHAKVEPEIAFVMGRDLRGTPSVVEALAAVKAVTVALEVIDSRFVNYEFQLPDVVADNCSSSAFVLGGKLVAPGAVKIENLGLTLEVNGRAAQFGSSAAILGHPGRSLAELVRLLDERGQFLPAGAIVLAGGATAAVPLEKGAWVRVVAESLGTAELRVAE